MSCLLNNELRCTTEFMKGPHCGLTIPKKIISAKAGRIAGMKNVKRGPEYFREIAAKRKPFKGGRPRKQTTSAQEHG